LRIATLSKKQNGKDAPLVPNGPKSSGSGPMDVSLLQSIVKLMQANDLNVVDLRDGDKRVMMKRGLGVASAPAPQIVAAPAAIPAAATHTSAPAAPAEPSEKFLEIKSPMVGTFYSAPSPDAKPFINVGSTVSEDTDVCVIEAMKVFNNVKAECRGIIAKILVNNSQVVEYGQVLFLVKP
jgi:acetyl-CoA carboxylase biotin carboxyl carrier protein